MVEDTRPEWKHETPEALARWLLSNSITKITHHWEMYDCDKSREWIVLHSEKNGSRKLATSFLNGRSEFVFAPNHRTLVSERDTYMGGSIRDTVDKIDKWEASNARDRAEFERLKTKFGS